MDNLNTHLRAGFEEVLGVETAATVLRRIEFHYTPKHASWLNMAEEVQTAAIGRRFVLCAQHGHDLEVQVL